MADYTVTEKTGAAIQAAVDAAHNAGGGRVCLEPGVYLSGTIYLKSNVELHLPAGSKIKGYSNPEQYDDFRDPGFDNVSPEGKPQVSDRGGTRRECFNHRHGRNQRFGTRFL